MDTLQIQFLRATEAEPEGFPGRAWEITLIGPASPGDLVSHEGGQYVRSKNERLYDCNGLRGAVPMFEGVKVYDNHLTDDEFTQRQGMRSVKDEWLGVVTGVAWNEEGMKLQGVFKVADRAFAEKLVAAEAAGALGYIGLSIDTAPIMDVLEIEGQQVPVVRGFRKIHSLDVVAEPAAGGAFERRIESTQTEEPKMSEELEKKFDELKAQVAALAEALTAPAAAAPAPVSEPEPQAPAEDSKAAEALTAIRSLECQIARDRKIGAAKLPEPMAALVLEAFPDGQVHDPAKVDAFIARTKEAQAAGDPSGRVTGSGQTDVIFDAADKAEVEFTRLLFGNTDFRKLEGNTEDFVQERIPESYRAWIKAGRPHYGTTRMSEWVRRLLGGDPMVDPRAYEAMTTSSMSSIVKNAMNVMLGASYSKRQRWYEPLVKMEEVDSIDDPTLVRTFGYNTLSVVNEGDAYSELAGADEEETAAFVKKGNYAGITLEALLRDKVNEVRRTPDKLANAWYNTLSAMVAGVFTTNTAAGPVLSDTGALFNATAATTAGGHANLLTTALSHTAFSAARTAMRKQTDRPLGVGQRLLIEPRYLLVPVDLETTGLQIRNSEKLPGSMDNDINPFYQKFDVVPVPEWTDLTDWAIMGDPELWPAIYLIFLRGLRVPELFTADNEASGALFTNDTIRYKVRMMTFRFSATYDVAPVADFRPLHKSNVA